MRLVVKHKEMAQTAKAAAALLLLGGGGFLIYRGAEQYFGSIAAQHKAAAEFAKSMPAPSQSTSSSGESTPRQSLPAFIPEGTPFSKLEVPRLHRALYVVEGDDDMALDKGPGHVRGSAMPGQNGNCVIAGHRDLHFRFLKDIELGDEIDVQDVQGSFTYKVTDTKIISPTQIEVLQPTATAQLHLITCYPFYFVGHSPKRFVVTAELVGQKPEVPKELLASNDITSAPHPHPITASSQPAQTHVRFKTPYTETEYERSLEATRALNRAAAGSL